MWLKKIPFAVILCACAAGPAHAAPADQAFRSGLSAYNSGNYAKAKSIWEPLAENEDAASQAGLGFMYHRGFGMAADDRKAAFWLRKAAEHGQAEGQMMLGSLYFYGQGVSQSYVQAFAWCDMAQDNGSADASMCRDSALAALTSKQDLKAAFAASLELHHRLSARR